MGVLLCFEFGWFDILVLSDVWGWYKMGFSGFGFESVCADGIFVCDLACVCWLDFDVCCWAYTVLAFVYSVGLGVVDFVILYWFDLFLFGCFRVVGVCLVFWLFMCSWEYGLMCCLDLILSCEFV